MKTVTVEERSNLLKKSILWCLMIYLLSYSMSAGAAEEASDKLDITNLEQKYWSAKDDDYTVVQNRTFTKNRRFFINFSTGRLINDGFLEGEPNSVALGYFFNEKNGFSIDYSLFKTKDNQVTQKSKEQLGMTPSYNSPVNATSIAYIWSPIYAKVSLLEKRILYLDLSIALRAGLSNYKMMTDLGGEIKQTSFYGVDVSQLWFLNKRFAFRFDIRNNWSSQEQLKYHIAANADESTRPIGATRLQDTTWLFGLNIFFGR
ncbi:MAG: hypothetical protein RJB66_346 [Pseudomonadota bacterium]|jgi:outer membrane beta-barrel protein